MKTISGHIADVVANRVFDGIVTYSHGRITSIEPSTDVTDQFIIPGLIDAHIHIESSMMTPSVFARQVLPHGTVACVCDPHEIANVCGIPGIDYMINDGKKSPLKFYFGAPSCVPATHVETSGAVLNATDIKSLLKRDDIHFLAEMMNFPGLLMGDEQVLLKLRYARDFDKPIDGHAPNLSGDSLRTYVDEGISTDHECMTMAEAKEKLALGMMILIREGSAARNLDDLMPLLKEHSDRVMFCSDDKHPDDLLKNGHIDNHLRRIVANGYSALDALRCCSLNPIKHYNLQIGLLQEGDRADFVVVQDLVNFKVLQTWIAGSLVAENGSACYHVSEPSEPINQFNTLPITVEALQIAPTGNRMRVIVAEDGQLQTKVLITEPNIEKGSAVSDCNKDVLKMVVYNRYHPAKPAIGFINGFGLKRGAIASTVAHDSHNIVAVGVSDKEIAAAINRLIECKGGIVAVDGKKTELLPLPVGGLMSNSDGPIIASAYSKADAMTKKMGSTLGAPFMTLAFMSLLVIPELKLGDKGLFEILKFSFTDLFTND
ncbi:MAG TPA: adenine deaminase [Bacteroidales bacterium]|nr:adenine deaminase [Bacteroidales bacterium]